MNINDGIAQISTQEIYDETLCLIMLKTDVNYNIDRYFFNFLKIWFVLIGVH